MTCCRERRISKGRGFQKQIRKGGGGGHLSFDASSQREGRQGALEDSSDVRQRLQVCVRARNPPISTALVGCPCWAYFKEFVGCPYFKEGKPRCDPSQETSWASLETSYRKGAVQGSLSRSSKFASISLSTLLGMMMMMMIFIGT